MTFKDKDSLSEICLILERNIFELLDMVILSVKLLMFNLVKEPF